MAVISKRSTDLTPRKLLKSRTNSGKKEITVSRGRDKTAVNTEKKHHHSPHPTRCLRGVSTRATFKRSPSPRKDWPFDEALLYPPHPRSSSFKNQMENKKLKLPKKHVLPSSRLSKSNPNSLINHHIHPTRCLRGVSTRASFKRSPSPKKNWQFDEATLCTTHPKNTYSRSPNIKKCSNEESPKTECSKRIEKNKKKVTKSPKNQKKIEKVHKIGKTPVKQIKRVRRSRIEKGNITQLSNLNSVVGDKSKANKYNFYTESIATVQDGEEDFVPSPMTGTHVGWGGTLLKKTHWSEILSSGHNLVQLSRPILWNEVHNGSFVWKPHKCINDYRLVSYSREHFNPYSNSSILQVAEYIWQLNKNDELDSLINPKFPALFELLFIKKNSFLSSILNKFYFNSITHDSIFRELITQSLFRNHNIVGINEIIEDTKFPYTVFVMEYLPYSSMFWNDETNSYEAPSLNLNIRNTKKVYTSEGSKLIFAEVIKGVEFLHKQGISGIYLRPESVKLSHSLDESFFDKEGRTLTKIINKNEAKTFFKKYPELKNSKININKELSEHWNNVQSISISSEDDISTIEFINNKISEKKVHSLAISEESFLFDPKIVFNAKQCKTNDFKKDGNKLFVKLSFIFKGKSTHSKELLFTGNRWLLPPELYMRMFNNTDNNIDFEKCDIWNLGILLHCFLTGKIPNFINNNIIIDEMVPLELRKLLISMLKSDPKQRITVNDILNSNWILY